jgi:Family of unknown function (DUF5715)
MRYPVAAAAAVFAVLSLAPVSARAWHESPLVANASSQAVQNARADAYNLSRMRNTAMIREFTRAGYLVPVPSRSRTYYLHEIPPAYRYLRPWTRLFLDRLSSEYYAQFGQPLRVTSLVRTVWSQSHLERRNPNAADAHGDTRSSHLTGATLDISKHDMSPAAERWMRRVLLSLADSGYIYAIEEFQEPNFHIMVYPDYRQYVARITGGSTEAASDDSRDSSGENPGND